MLAATALLASLASAALTTTSSTKFSAVASAGPDAATTTLCVSATVPADTWIGIGLPADSATKAPVMEGSDLLLFYAAGTTPTLLVGKGSNHAFVKNDALATLKINSAKSSYTGGVLTGCVDVAAAKVANGAASYLWGVGKVSGGTPQQHSESQSVTGVNLFAAAPTAGKSSAVVSVAGLGLVGIATAAVLFI
ncbi:hypothetical protein BDR26DRAFT_867345 [Obelidium mucronatum]|nr:hypothetical protein BDR26DRAFT_867345 [Obelidium mucronatum]